MPNGDGTQTAQATSAPQPPSPVPDHLSDLRISPLARETTLQTLKRNLTPEIDTSRSALGPGHEFENSSPQKEGEQQYREMFGSPLERGYGHLKSWLGKHEGQISEKYLAPIREHLDRMGNDLVQAGETGHTKTGGQLTPVTRLLTLGTGELLKQVPIGANVKETLAANIVPPEFGPEGKALSEELRAAEKVEQPITVPRKRPNAPDLSDLRIVKAEPRYAYPPESEQRKSFGREDRISTRLPSSPKASENPLEGEPLTVGRDVVRNSPGLAQRLADQVRNYNGLRVPKHIKEPEKVLDHFQKHLEGNIEWAHKQAIAENPAKVAENRKWYESANKLATTLSDKYGMERRQGAGIIASQSPQKDWDMNVNLAERLADIYHTKNDIKFTPAMSAKAKELATKSDELKKVLSKLEGKTLSELKYPDERAAWIRIYDEAHNPRSFHKIDPGTGERVGLRVTKKGEPADVAWGSLKEMAKAVRIIEDGSRENISANLGDAHKVRNFYNNIADPTHAHDVTIDTHAVAVAHMMPFGGKAPEVKANFDGPASNFTGSTGTYPIYADAYRNVAKKLGLLPRELQSVDWEWGRDLFDAMKTNDGLKYAKKQWKLYEDGKQTADQTRMNIMNAAKRFKGVK